MKILVLLLATLVLARAALISDLKSDVMKDFSDVVEHSLEDESEFMKWLIQNDPALAREVIKLETENEAAEFDGVPSTGAIFREALKDAKQILRDHMEQIKGHFWEYLMKFIKRSLPMIEEIKEMLEDHTMNVMEAIRVAVTKTMNEIMKPNEKKQKQEVVTDEQLEGEFKDQIAAKIRQKAKTMHLDFSSYFNRVWNAAKSHFKEAKEKIVDHHMDLHEAVSDTVSDIVDNLSPGAEFSLDENDMQEFADTPSSTWGIFREIVREGKQILRDHMEDIKGHFFEYLRKFIAKVIPHLGELRDKLFSHKAGLMEDIANVVKDAMNEILVPVERKKQEKKLEEEIEGEFSEQVARRLREHAADVGNHFSSLYQRIMNVGRKAFKQIKQNVLDRHDDLKDAVSETLDKVIDEAGVSILQN